MLSPSAYAYQDLEIRIPPTGLFIDGGFVEPLSGELFPTHFPATGALITTVASAGAEDVDRAVRAARSAFEEGPWGRWSPRERSERIHRWADHIESHAEEIARLETLDTGKPFWKAHRVDLPNVLKCLRFYAGAALTLDGETLPVGPDSLTFTLREPLGVCGLIIPWNFPMLMVAWKCGPALAAGNTVVLKPAEQTSLSALRLAELAAEGRDLPGVLNVINGPGASTGAALAAHPDVDKIAFTGSTATGRKILAASAGSNLKRVSLELGGKSPVIVYPDADLDLAAEECFDGIYYGAGQVCSAGSRLLAAESVKDAMVERLLAKIRKRRVGDPFDPATQQGALISEAHWQKVHGMVTQAQEQGARLLAGGARVGEGPFYAPTLMDCVSPEMTIAREEAFGPVLAVLTFPDNDPDAALRLANDSDYGLAAAIFTRDMALSLRAARRLRCGVVWINGAQRFDPVAPFGGVKGSGFGRDLGRHALDEYVNLKCIWLNTRG